ncbi:MAG: di-heme oxidoredictase family protein [Bacteroidota bacterium]
MRGLPLHFLAILCMVFGCGPKADNYLALYEEGEELSSEGLGINSQSSNAFGFEVKGLTFKEKAHFATGNSLFNQSWVSSPASTTARDGLGPTFNARACASCHFKDGRGKPILIGEKTNGFLMRVSQKGTDENDGPLGLQNYGTQIQDQSNRGIPIEAKISVTYDTITGAYPDGKPYVLFKPIYIFENENFGKIEKVMTSPRVAQQTIGMGFISALPDSEILKLVDENDENGDGISGRPNYVWNHETGEKDLGKYGWKANAPTLKTQIASAFHGDMGLTSPIFPKNDCPSPQKDCDQAPNGGEPEVTEKQLKRVLFYQASLAVPNRRNVKNEKVLKGKVLFNQLNCIGCHAINQVTGKFPLNPLLEDITIKPYSDFLLHDMGEELADNRPDFEANGKEWRTQPLWGIGLIPTVNRHTYFLHDGRARSIEEAILWHGGEAEKSKKKFMRLPEKEREQLLAFINSL